MGNVPAARLHVIHSIILHRASCQDRECRVGNFRRRRKCDRVSPSRARDWTWERGARGHHSTLWKCDLPHLPSCNGKVASCCGTALGWIPGEPTSSGKVDPEGGGGGEGEHGSEREDEDDVELQDAAETAGLNDGMARLSVNSASVGSLLEIPERVPEGRPSPPPAALLMITHGVLYRSVGQQLVARG